jgi:hypothetical protein
MGALIVEQRQVRLAHDREAAGIAGIEEAPLAARAAADVIGIDRAVVIGDVADTAEIDLAMQQLAGGTGQVVGKPGPNFGYLGQSGHATGKQDRNQGRAPTCEHDASDDRNSPLSRQRTLARSFGDRRDPPHRFAHDRK